MNGLLHRVYAFYKWLPMWAVWVCAIVVFGALAFQVIRGVMG